jgi:hypothetical protein
MSHITIPFQSWLPVAYQNVIPLNTNITPEALFLQYTFPLIPVHVSLQCMFYWILLGLTKFGTKRKALVKKIWSTKDEPYYNHLPTVLWSRNFLFPLRLRLSKSFGSGSTSGSGAGSDLSFLSTFYHRFHFKKSIFMFFMKEYQPNSHAGFYTIWILIFIYYSSWPGAGSRSRNFAIPAPAKSSGSLRLRLHNTAFQS